MKKILVAASLTTLFPSLALAHHPLAGMPMETFSHGLLSGLGHPILGFDHLFFVALVGIAAVYTAHRFWTPFAFIGAMLLGCLQPVQAGQIRPYCPPKKIGKNNNICRKNRH